MTASLIEVRPAAGDYVRVIDSGRGCWAPGCHWDGELQGPAAAGMYRVHYKGRFADVAIEPDWPTSWPVGAVHWRELVPWPHDGVQVLRRVGDAHDWTVHLVLFSVTARDALTFDAYHMVILFVPPPAPPGQYAPTAPEPFVPDEYSEPASFANLDDMMNHRERWDAEEERRRWRWRQDQDEYERQFKFYQRLQANYPAVLAAHEPEYTRCWIRWCYSSHAFIPVCDPAKLRALKAALPDGRVDCPLFDEAQR